MRAYRSSVGTKAIAGCAVIAGMALTVLPATPAGAQNAPVQRTPQWLARVRIKVNVNNQPIDDALAAIFAQVPFDYLYADNGSAAELESFGCSLPLDRPLDTLRHAAVTASWSTSGDIVVAQQDVRKDDPTAARIYSGRVRLTPLSDALEALKTLHMFRFRVEDGRDPLVIDATFARLSFDDAIGKIAAQCETPLKWTRSGDIFILSRDPAAPKPALAGVTASPAIAHGNPPPLQEGRANVDVKGSLDDVLYRVFAIFRKRYRISAAVTDSSGR
ncbi:MAG TPA: hypothetical protein VKT77_02770 [Chthonomonadaceae bacterium]|nr:hypothetical protein [Chthonomonadaceae bacterium]